MKAAGISTPTIEKYIKCIGLTGDEALSACANLPNITPEQAQALYDITYKKMASDVLRLMTKDDVVKAYGRPPT